MGLTLLDGLKEIPVSFFNEKSGRVDLPDKYLHPGFIAVLAAFCKKMGIKKSKFTTATSVQYNYLDAMKLYETLWGIDNYSYDRKNNGIKYSCLTHLYNEDQVDSSTTSINSCIRKFVSDCNPYPKGITSLLHVVGELHDNVWSHGKASGFSLAQKIHNFDRSDFIIEFALADHGMGFLAELRRIGLDRSSGITSHKQAIEWCLERGNSSKSSDFYDGWEQSVPSDYIGDGSLSSILRVKTDDNNHQGLGLWHLIQLINDYNGELQIASGDTCLCFKDRKKKSYSLPVNWKGVAISCTLSLRELSKAPTVQESFSDVELTDIISQLQSGEN